MAINGYNKSFFKAVRLRKGEVPATLEDHCQVYASEAGVLRVILPNGDDVDLSTALAGPLVNKGGYNAAMNTPNLVTPAAGAVKNGYVYTVTAAGTFFGQALEIGDMLLCDQDNPTALAHWTIVERSLTGAVTTGGTLTSGNLVTGAGAQAAQDGGTALSTVTGHIASTSNPHSVTASQAGAPALAHGHSGTTDGSQLAQANTHTSPDTDGGASSLHHTLGTGANQACGGTDGRLSDARTPVAHAGSHVAAGTDPVTVAPTTVFEVDGNRVDVYTPNGSDAAPFKTIGAAAAVAVSPATIRVSPKSGGYTEDVTLSAGVSLEGWSSNAVGIVGNVVTTAGGNTSLRYLNFAGSGKTVTINNACSIIDCYSANAVVVAGTAIVQAWNFHIVPPTGIVPLTISSTGKYQAVLATIASTGDVPAVAQSAGQLVLNLCQVTASRTGAVIALSGGTVALVGCQVTNGAAGVAVDLTASGAISTNPNLIADLAATGNVVCGAKDTIIEGVEFIAAGALTGSVLTFRPFSQISGTADGNQLPAMSATKKGGVPATGTPSGKFLKDDGTFAAVSGGQQLADFAMVMNGSAAGGSTILFTEHFMPTTGKIAMGEVLVTVHKSGDNTQSAQAPAIFLLREYYYAMAGGYTIDCPAVLKDASGAISGATFYRISDTEHEFRVTMTGAANWVAKAYVRWNEITL